LLRVKPCERPKNIPHQKQQKWFSIQCVLAYEKLSNQQPSVCSHVSVEVSWTRKIFSTLPATIRFVTEYVRIFVLSLLAMENLFPHFRQQKGFSPVCVSMCTVKLLAVENHFPHSWQQNVFSPVFVRMCFVRVLTPENLFPHS